MMKLRGLYEILNGVPFNTTFEKTFRSGVGSVLFVIGPDLTLYCGSHVEGVFHHSSFLDRGAIVVGGEIKTDASGKIIELFGNSGHYRPDHTHNKDALFYFKDRGMNCSEVNIKFYSSKGIIETQNAQEYLDTLEVGLNP